GGQRELVKTGGAAVRQQLLLCDRAGQRRRGQDPAQPDRGRQRLADRAEGEHPVRGDALQHPDRLTVVAELRVVVVLDDVAVATAGPLHHLVPPPPPPHHPEERRVPTTAAPRGARWGPGYPPGRGPGGRPAGPRRPRGCRRPPGRAARPP